jgi:hypothetical protein
VATQILEPLPYPALDPESLGAWTRLVTLELAAAGFWVRILDGFPTVRLPEGLEECVRRLGFQPSVHADRLIAKEGVIFFPPGAMSATKSCMLPIPTGWRDSG